MRYFFPFLLLFFLACGDGLEILETTNHLGYKSVFKVDPESGLKLGEYRQYDEAGNLLELAHYHQDVLVGQRILFSPAGDTLVVEHYLEQDFKVAKDNQESHTPTPESTFAGEYRTFYETGNLIKQRGQYVAGAMNGEWKKYYQNGQLAETVTFVDNLENGPFKEWHENGNLKATGNYLNGDQEHGELRLYDESGTLEKIMSCNGGICQTTWRITDETPAPAPSTD